MGMRAGEAGEVLRPGHLRGSAAQQVRRSTLSETRKYRKFTPQQKLELVMASWRGERSIAELCREHDISESLLRRWREQGAGGRDGALRRGRAALPRRRAEAADRRARTGAGKEDLRAGDR